MHYVILGGLAVAVAFGLAQMYVNLDTRTLISLARYVGGTVLILIGIGLTLARQIQFGLPAIVFGVMTLIRGRLGPFNFGTSSKSSGQASTVKSRFIEATLDHDSGSLSGKVVSGRFSGDNLDDLDEEDLIELLREIDDDADSRALLEAYIDRRFPGWRDDRQDDGAAGPRGSADSGAMTEQEAYEILGLSAGASEAEIRAAHRRLLKGVHPDQGGSTFLAARINQAKDRLLGKHR